MTSRICLRCTLLLTRRSPLEQMRPTLRRSGARQLTGHDCISRRCFRPGTIKIMIRSGMLDVCLAKSWIIIRHNMLQLPSPAHLAGRR